MESGALTAITGSIISSLLVGVALAFFQKTLNKNVEDAKEASEQKFKNLEDKVDHVDREVSALNTKMGHVEEKVNSLTSNLVALGTDQKYLMRDISDLKNSVKDANARMERFGKVIHKL